MNTYTHGHIWKQKYLESLGRDAFGLRSNKDFIKCLKACRNMLEASDATHSPFRRRAGGAWLTIGRSISLISTHMNTRIYSHPHV